MFWGIAAACLVALTLIWMVSRAYRTAVEVQEAEFERLPAGFDGSRLFFISDIHRRVIPDRLIEECRAAGGADLVLVGGDMREKGVPLERTRQNIRKLREIAPIYAVYGNHDYDGDIRALDVMLQEEGVRVLVNEHVLLERQNGAEILLCGVDDPHLMRDNLQTALDRDFFPAKADDMPFTILLAHDPMIADRINGTAVDLILSGHTHGGQIALPLFGPLHRSPTILKYLFGWHEPEVTKSTGTVRSRMFVSRGFGTSKMPLRSFAPAETNLIILRSPHSKAPDRLLKDR